MRRVTIGIPACDDDPAVVTAALAALAAEPHNDVLVMDMSRSDAIATAVRGQPQPPRYIAFPESRGISDSRNRILELAKTRHVLFLDADAVPRPGWAAALARVLDDGHTLAGARIVPHWARRPAPLIDSTPGRELLGNLDCGDVPRLLPRVMGTSFGVDRELLPPLAEPFNPALGHRPGQLLGQEEVQLSLKVLAAGGTIGYAPDAVVDHHIREGRATWLWMARRIVREGRDRRPALESFPRPLGARDRAFQVVTAPLFVAGRLQGRDEA